MGGLVSRKKEEKPNKKSDKFQNAVLNIVQSNRDLKQSEPDQVEQQVMVESKPEENPGAPDNDNLIPEPIDPKLILDLYQSNIPLDDRKMFSSFSADFHGIFIDATGTHNKSQLRKMKIKPKRINISKHLAKDKYYWLLQYKKKLSRSDVYSVDASFKQLSSFSVLYCTCSKKFALTTLSTLILFLNIRSFFSETLSMIATARSLSLP
jgi:hypothetical protein